MPACHWEYAKSIIERFGISKELLSSKFMNINLRLPRLTCHQDSDKIQMLLFTAGNSIARVIHSMVLSHLKYVPHLLKKQKGYEIREYIIIKR